MNPSQMFSRRQFFALSATIGAGAVLASCAGGSSTDSTVASGKVLEGLEGNLQVAKRFSPDAIVPGKIRLPISLADKTGVLPTDGKVRLPDVLTGKVINPETGDVVIEKVSANRYDENMSVPYWPIVVDIKEQGIYVLKLDVAPDADVSFQVLNPADVVMPKIGDPLPPFDTPTEDNARGVDPICTRPEGTCPFHTMTLTEALKSGKPVVYFVGTPAYCTTGTCAPGLDALIELSKTIGNKAVFVHADVYKDKTATEAAPAIQAYKLSYEPLLYITDAKGVQIDRLDAIFDAKELRETLAAAGIS
ncbi:MAG: hypothetical protein RL114_103 [Actinomycetota bacterium]